MMFRKIRNCLLGFAAAGLVSFPAQAADTIKIGHIDPFSGPIAAVGLEGLDNTRHAAAAVNARGGVLGGRMFEIVPLDNVMKAEKTTQQVRKAADSGIRFIMQGVGSSHALNIIKNLNKHNQRNPKKSILFLNHSAVTTAFTNELCSFWHFRFDANVDQKAAGLTTMIGRDPNIKRVYLLNQNYVYGKSFQAASRQYLKERAPNVKIVGDDLMIPFGKVQDFTPYVAKVAQGKADAILTGNWGPDFLRFVKAVADAGLDVKFYSIYAGIPSSVKGYGEAAGIKLKIRQITENHENDEDRPEVLAFAKSYKDKFGSTWYPDRYRIMVDMLAAAIEKAGSADPIAVGYAMEGLTANGPKGQKILMRATDHQIIMPMVVSQIDQHALKKFVYKRETFGIGWKTDGWISQADMALPTTCKMKRPRR